MARFYSTLLRCSYSTDHGVAFLVVMVFKTPEESVLDLLDDPGIVGAAPGFLCGKEGGIASTAFGDSSASGLLLWGGSSRAYCGLRPLRLAQGVDRQHLL